MKRFKKKHTKIPRPEVIRRLIRTLGPELKEKFDDDYADSSCVFPEEIRLTSLPQMDRNKRQNIKYYPDLHNWAMYDSPNRSLPIPKFLDMYRPFVDNALLDKLAHDLTSYRLEFYTTADKWEEVYADGTIHSCMTGSTIVRCYVHPQNKLALAALYAPGGNELIARTIVNTDEKWYVRLFGNELLVDKLKELGYSKINGAPRAFRMWAWVGPRFTRDEYQVPYFDFPSTGVELLRDTHNPDTGYVEIIVNPGNIP